MDANDTVMLGLLSILEQYKQMLILIVVFLEY